MKQLHLILISLTILLSGCGITSSQSGSARKTEKSAKRSEDFAKTSTLIESGNYIYRIQSINPTGGRTIQSTSLYTMKASNGTFEAYLPYFGRAYQADLGGKGGIEFKGDPEDLTIVKNSDKYSVTVTFKIKGSNDRYNVIFVVGSNGYGTLTIDSQNRQTISYYGTVGELTEE
ncbi:MAG: DUF4251 domain-containing protein [Bacteroidota bacterium]